MTAVRDEGPSRRRRVVFVSPVMPAHTGNGLAMRAGNLIQALHAQGCSIRVLVIPLFDSGSNSLDPHINAVCEKFSCVTRPKTTFLSRMKDRLQSALQGPPAFRVNIAWKQKIDVALREEMPVDVLFVFRFSALSCLSYRRCKSLKIVLDLDELDSGAIRREAQLGEENGGYAEASALRFRAAAMEKIEQRWRPLPNLFFVSSEIEKKRLPPDLRGKTTVLPNVVPERELLQLRSDDRGPWHLLFVGSFGHDPNVDAAIYFCREILPRIRSQTSREVEFTLVGPDYNEKLAPLRKHEQVRILGRVAELSPVYQEADLVVVPLRAGAGTRIKILEAFSYGRPVVSTSIGAEGLQIASGMELMLADTPAAFAESCADLLASVEKRKSLANAAHDFFLREHTPGTLQKALASAWTAISSDN